MLRIILKVLRSFSGNILNIFREHLNHLEDFLGIYKGLWRFLRNYLSHLKDI